MVSALSGLVWRRLRAAHVVASRLAMSWRQYNGTESTAETIHKQLVGQAGTYHDGMPVPSVFPNSAWPQLMRMFAPHSARPLDPQDLGRF